MHKRRLAGALGGGLLGAGDHSSQGLVEECLKRVPEEGGGQQATLNGCKSMVIYS